MPYVLVRLPATIDTNPVARVTALSGADEEGTEEESVEHRQTSHDRGPVLARR